MPRGVRGLFYPHGQLGCFEAMLYLPHRKFLAGSVGRDELMGNRVLEEMALLRAV